VVREVAADSWMAGRVFSADLQSAGFSGGS
jgi:hypothetical protein